MLGKSMRKYVMGEKKYDKNTQYQYNKRIREYVILALKDLALLAERLPEEQLQEIFNEKTLGSFFKALIKIEIPAKDHEEYLKKRETDPMRQKRQRLQQICWMILGLVGNTTFVRNLVPENWKPWILGAHPPIDNIKAVFYTAMLE
jgi:hypothetical protein